MHRATSPHGAGRTTTGFAPISTPKTAISNRNFSQLETRATHRKHSPDAKSNRNFRSTNSHPWERWGRHSCLRNAAEFGRSRIHAEECQRHDEVPHTPLNCARTLSTQRVTQAGVGLCAVAVASAPPPLTSSRGPFTGRRISLRVAAVTPRTLTAAPVVSHLIISNRSTRRLELPETYTKQRTDPLSNRHKFTHQLSTCHPTWCPTSHRAQRVGQPPKRSSYDHAFPKSTAAIGAPRKNKVRSTQANSSLCHSLAHGVVRTQVMDGARTRRQGWGPVGSLAAPEG
jgi:hypothetical protein